MGILESLDPAAWSINTGSIIGKIAIGISITLWAVIIGLGGYMLLKYLSYRIPVEIYEKQGNALILTGSKRARKKTRDNVEEYELLYNIRGLLPMQEKFLKWFRVDNTNHMIPTRKGIAFKLIKTGDAFYPIAISNPDTKLEIIPQTLLWWFTSKIRQINEKYSDRKWWEPYVLPFSMIVVVIILFLMWIMMLDKSTALSDACARASESITSKLGQTIK